MSRCVERSAPFEEISRRVVDHGVPADEGLDEDAKVRGVERFLRFRGPNGLTQEIYTTARTSSVPLGILGSGFVTGAGGLGCVALTAEGTAPRARLLQPRLRRASFRVISTIRSTA
jgi:hypothetical protein